MKRYYWALVLILLVCSVLRTATQYIRPSWLRKKEIRLTKKLNAEGRIALGDRIFLSKAGIYELELIPGVSDRLAFRIYKEKQKILKALKRMEQAEALSIIHGIGPKTSVKILRYLDLK